MVSLGSVILKQCYKVIMHFDVHNDHNNDLMNLLSRRIKFESLIQILPQSLTFESVVHI